MYLYFNIFYSYKNGSKSYFSFLNFFLFLLFSVFTYICLAIELMLCIPLKLGSPAFQVSTGHRELSTPQPYHDLRIILTRKFVVNDIF